MTPTIILAAILVVLNILDVISTRKALKNPSNYESNPIIAKLMKLGNLWIVIKMGVVGLAIYFAWDTPVVLAVFCLIFAYVVRRNFKLAG